MLYNTHPHTHSLSLYIYIYISCSLFTVLIQEAVFMQAPLLAYESAVNKLSPAGERRMRELVSTIQVQSVCVSVLLV
jgi:hypothetical protein